MEPAGSAAKAAAAGKKTVEPAGSATKAAAAGKKAVQSAGSVEAKIEPKRQRDLQALGAKKTKETAGSAAMAAAAGKKTVEPARAAKAADAGKKTVEPAGSAAKAAAAGKFFWVGGFTDAVFDCSDAFHIDIAVEVYSTSLVFRRYQVFIKYAGATQTATAGKTDPEKREELKQAQAKSVELQPAPARTDGAAVAGRGPAREPAKARRDFK